MELFFVNLRGLRDFVVDLELKKRAYSPCMNP